MHVTRGVIQLSVRPATVSTGQRVRFRFHATSAGRPLRGALIAFHGRTARTGRRGNALITLAFGRAHRYRASASKPEYTTGHAHVSVTRR